MAQRRRLAIAALSVATVAVVGAQLTGRDRPVPAALETSGPDATWPTPTTIARSTTTTVATTVESAVEPPAQAEVDSFLLAWAAAAEAGPVSDPSQSDIDSFLAALAAAGPTSTTRSGDCDPNYGGCVPIDTDVDCLGGNGDGPSYAEGVFEVIGQDIYGLDPDGDLLACEPV